MAETEKKTIMLRPASPPTSPVDRFAFCLRRKTARNAAAFPWAIVLLAGCATHVPPHVTAEGHLPGGPDANFTLAPPADASAEALAQCLVNAGMARSDRPTYYVQILQSRHPGDMLVLAAGHRALPSALPPAARPVKPWPAKAAVETLSLSISAMADGQEVYRARVERMVPTAHGGHPPAAPLSSLLCDDAILPLKAPAQPR